MKERKGVNFVSARVVALCLVCFMAGRFLRLPGLPETGTGPVVVREERQTAGVSSSSSSSSSSTTHRRSLVDGAGSRRAASHETFEEVMEASGLLDDRPPVEHGASGHSFYTVQPMQLLSWHPRAYLFPKFIDESMCKHVIELAESRLRPSGLALKKGDTLSSTREIRTSQGTFLSRMQDKDGVLAYIEDKIAVMTGVPAAHGEPFNVLRYENGQHYDSHYDAFDEASYGKQFSQRVATVLVYLSDVEEGGETSFLFEGVNGTKRLSTVDYKTCNTGIKYKPRAGDALLFWSIHPDHTSDKHALHGGCPVRQGTKWTATKWIRDKCQYIPGGLPCSNGQVP